MTTFRFACPSCDRTLRATAKHIGRTLACPNCSESVTVPSEPSSVDSIDSISEEGQTAVESSSVSANEGRFPAIQTAAPHRKIVSRSGSHKKPSKRSRKLLAALLSIVSAGVLVAATVFLVLPRKQTGQLILDWPADTPRDAALEISETGTKTKMAPKRLRIPQSGPVSVELTPGSYQAVLLCRKHSPERFSFAISRGKDVTIRPHPEPLDSLLGSAGTSTNEFKDWVQDLEKAKRTASDQKKDILIVFHHLTGNGVFERLSQEVLLTAEFRKILGDQFVTMLIEYVQDSIPAEHVKDPERNARLVQSYAIDRFPTIMLTDEQGKPYGSMGYVQGGLRECVDAVTALQENRRQRDQLFQSVTEAGSDLNVQVAARAVNWLYESLPSKQLIHFYALTVEGWLEQSRNADPMNRQGIQEIFFEADWLARLVGSSQKGVGSGATPPERARNQLSSLIQELKTWNDKTGFQSEEIGARMFLMAARVLQGQGDSTRATAMARQGLEFDSKNSNTVAALRDISDRQFAAVGSGFVVHADGYLLTNHHVAVLGKPFVRIPGIELPIPAQVTAQDRDKDIALLKIDVPTGVNIQVLDIAPKSLVLAEEAGVFGFPLGNRMGAGVKFSKASVHATEDETDTGMVALDGRINPGNSGGPLCNSAGQVVGMVTAKSIGSSQVDSYGIALPGAELQTFLSQHLPGYSPSGQAINSTPRNWTDVAAAVGPAVFAIMNQRS